MANISLKDIEDVCRREFNENYLNPYLNEIVDKHFFSMNKEELKKIITKVRAKYLKV